MAIRGVLFWSRTLSKSHDEMDAIIREIANEPKRDNRSYLAAVAKARDAVAQAEAHFDAPVKVTTKTKVKASGKFVVKLTFERAD